MAWGKKLLLSLSVFAIRLRKLLPDGSRVKRQLPGWFESLVICPLRSTLRRILSRVLMYFWRSFFTLTRHCSAVLLYPLSFIFWANKINTYVFMGWGELAFNVIIFPNFNKCTTLLLGPHNPTTCHGEKFFSVFTARGRLAIGRTGRISGGLAANLACCPAFFFFYIYIIYYYYFILLLLFLLPTECTKVIISEFAIQ